MANNTTEAAETALFRVSTVEYYLLLSIWLIYCCTGHWAPDQPLRIITLLQGCAKLIIINLWFGTRDLAMSLFVTYMLGRCTLSTDRFGLCQGTVVVFWMILDTFNVFFRSFRIANIVCEALMAIGILGYVIVLTQALQERGRGRWLLKLCAIILWCLGWGVIAVLCWIKQIDQVIAVIWFMTYAACFPRSGTPASPGPSPSITLRSPWLAALARRRAMGID